MNPEILDDVLEFSIGTSTKVQGRNCNNCGNNCNKCGTSNCGGNQSCGTNRCRRSS